GDDIEAVADPLDALVDHIADRAVLLVVDNCEHVVDAAAKLVEDLLGRCPGLRVIATSREPLRIAGEVAVPIDPLDSDDAVALFVDRATGRDNGAAAAAPDRVNDICSRLDGIPLAIELAAGQLLTNPLDDLT